MSFKKLLKNLYTLFLPCIGLTISLTVDKSSLSNYKNGNIKKFHGSIKWMLYKMGLIDNILRLPLIELDTKYHEIISAEMIKLQLI